MNTQGHLFSGIYLTHLTPTIQISEVTPTFHLHIISLHGTSKIFKEGWAVIILTTFLLQRFSDTPPIHFRNEEVGSYKNSIWGKHQIILFDNIMKMTLMNKDIQVQVRTTKHSWILFSADIPMIKSVFKG